MANYVLGTYMGFKGLMTHFTKCYDLSGNRSTMSYFLLRFIYYSIIVGISPYSVQVFNILRINLPGIIKTDEYAGIIKKCFRLIFCVLFYVNILSVYRFALYCSFFDGLK